MANLNYVPPKAMQTPHGVPMSLRARTVYGWLGTQGVHLTPFSTDECVARCLPQLKAAAALLESYEQDLQVKRLLTDVQAIMRRLPAARAERINVRAAEPAAEEPAPDAGEQVEAAIGRSRWGGLEID